MINKNTRYKIIVTTHAITMLGIGLSAVPAMAEGNQNWTGAYGVNRVVITPPGGYLEVSGTFDSLQLAVPSNRDQVVDLQTDPYHSRPTIYLGGSGPGAGAGNPRLEVDTFIQYEPTVLFGADPGWAAQISQNPTFTSPSIWTAAGAKAWRGNATSYFLHYNVWDTAPAGGSPVAGAISMRVQGGGDDFTFFLRAGGVAATAARPARPDAADAQAIMSVTQAHLESHSAKRVIGMTQRTNYTSMRYGAFLEARFNCNQLVRYVNGTRTPVNWVWRETIGGTDYFRVAQNAAPGVRGSGHDTVETGPDAYDALVGGAVTPHSTYILRFPQIDALAGHDETDTAAEAREVARTNNNPLSYQLTEGGVSRYQRETVHVYLRKAIRPEGRTVDAKVVAP